MLKSHISSNIFIMGLIIEQCKMERPMDMPIVTLPILVTDMYLATDKQKMHNGGLLPIS